MQQGPRDRSQAARLLAFSRILIETHLATRSA
jgi:hypothetical protein